MNMNFYEKRKSFYIVSIVLIAISLISLLVRGINKGIDFQSGTLIEVAFEETRSIEEVREVLKKYELDNAGIVVGDNGAFTIKAAEIDQETQTQVFATFEEDLGKYELLRTESVGPTIGKELTTNGLVALAVASVLMVIYISIRFQFKAAIAAICCLLHDCLIMLGLFSLFQIEIESSFIAAILTIIGYSINNTIVIFDRIREERKLAPKLSDGALVNLSIKKSMTRSINMALVVLIVLLALLFFGGSTTRTLALALTIGNIAGFYSSVFISGNIWADFRTMGK